MIAAIVMVPEKKENVLVARGGASTKVKCAPAAGDSAIKSVCSVALVKNNAIPVMAGGMGNSG